MGEQSPIGIRRNMNIKLTNGKKTIIRPKVQYEANLEHFKQRGFKPLNEKKTTKKDNVVNLKPKAKHGKTKKSSSKSKKKT